MSPMRWTEAMSVGVAELDADHRVLIRIINHLAENAGKAERAKVLRQCLIALRRYAEFHFAREERVMAACDYPEMDHHSGEHRAFTDYIGALARQIDAEDASAVDVVSDALLSYLYDWLNHHILIQDMAYRPFAETDVAAKEAARNFRASEIWWNQ